MNTDARGMESGGHRCAVFDAITGVALACCHHDDIVLAVAFSLDGRRVTSASRDGSARIFDVTTGAELARLDPDATVVRVNSSQLARLGVTRPSATFHGRDIFAPIGAEVAAGRCAPESLGEVIDKDTIVPSSE